MKRYRSIAALALCAALLLGAAACGKKQDAPATEQVNYSYSKAAEAAVSFGGSDEELASFLSDFYQRHVRNGAEAIHPLQLGQGAMFLKEWEAQSLLWGNATGSAISYDGYSNIAKYINNIPVDKYGYVWTEFPRLINPTLSGRDAQTWGQGWPFPNYVNSLGNSVGFEFNDDEQWTTNLPDSTTLAGGLLSVKASRQSRVEFTSPEFSPVKRQHAPFLNADFRLYDSSAKSSSIGDVYVYWRSEGDEDFSEAKKVSLLNDTTMERSSLSATFAEQVYFPMYLNEGWDDVVQLKVVMVPKAGKKINSNINLNFLRLDYDTRHTNNITMLLEAAKTYYEFTGDKTILKSNLSRLRAAMLFMTETLGGKNGYITQESMVGHDGVRGVGHGIGQGYWDILASPAVSFYGNVYYVRALQAMAYLEDAAAALGIEADMPTVTVGDGSGDTVTYYYTADSLRELEQKTVAQLRKDYASPIQNADGSFSFNPEGGLWDSAKGRFIEGFNAEGDKIDYGYVAFNLEAIYTGIPTDTQAKEIMDWISGARVVEGDTAQGKTGSAFGSEAADAAEFGIYDLEFAPRSTTVKNSKYYVWEWGGANLFGEQVQDGGAMMYVSFYDIMARLKVYGYENALGRLKEIQAWYNKVEECAKRNGVGTDLPATEFYRVYYDEIGITMQGNDTAGGIGLDYEFLEAALFYACVPYGVFGLSSPAPDVLAVSPAITGDGNMKIENLRFSGVVYDLSAGANFVQVNSVRGDTRGKTLSVTLASPAGDFHVFVNGKAVAKDRYTVADGKVTVSVPFAAGRVSIG